MTFKCAYRPCKWKRISQLYHSGHKGIDLAAPKGTRVVAVADGVVDRVGYGVLDKSYGYQVFLKHDGGYYTNYAHASKLCVKKGDHVVAGQKIMEVGNTGRSFGNHLHFEVWNKRSFKNRINPKPYIDRALATPDKDPTSPNYKVSTEGSVLNVRNLGDKSAKVVNRIPNGTRVYVSKVVQEWGYVPSFKGWVYMKYLKKV